MDIDMDFKPNSHAYKANQKNDIKEKKVEKVVKGTVKTKKKSEITRLKDVFIAEDVSSVKSYILMDVLVPAVKKAISDIVRDGIDMILFGGSTNKKTSYSGNYVSYRDYSRPTSYRSESRARSTSSFNFDDLIYPTRGEAEAVLEQMCEVIDRYGIVTIADMYDMADLTPPYTGNKYGWSRLGTAEVVRYRDAYIIKLPKAMPIDSN